MNYTPYTPKHHHTTNNPYTSPSYPNPTQYPSYPTNPSHYPQTPSSKVPQTLFHPSPTPHKQTLIRNQSFQNRLYNQDLIQLIAKIRSLQDDLINERFKNESLERKVQEYEKIIDNLEYELTQQAYQMQKYLHEIQLSNEKNLEIMKYEQNLKIVGEEIEELNNVLVMKNREFDEIRDRNKMLEDEAKRLEEEMHLMRVTLDMWRKEIQSICEEYYPGGSTRDNADNKGNTQRSGYNNPQKQFHSSSNQFSSLNKQPTSRHSPTEPFSQPLQAITQSLSHLRTIISSLSQQLKSHHHQSENIKRELSSSLIREKEKCIKLEYEYKLLEQRQRDNSKSQDLVASYCNQQKAEEIIQELMQKEDDYIKRIEEISQENESLREEISAMESSNEYFQRVDLQEKNSMIENLKRQNLLLENTISELTHKIKNIELTYEAIVDDKCDEIQKETQNASRTARKNRKVEEENYQLQIKIEELGGEVEMLRKEIQILKGDEEEREKGEEGEQQ